MEIMMMNRQPVFLTIFHFSIIGSVMAIVALTALVPQYRNLLLNVTSESGFFEIGTFIILILISGYCIRLLKISRRPQTPAVLLRLVGLTACLTLVAGFEEISWGQHFFGFRSADFFMNHNRQHETNLHNLIPAEIFGLLTNAGIYILFVFLPLFCHYYLSGARTGPRKFPAWADYVPSLHNILMFCFAFSLQAFFLPETAADTVILLIGIGMTARLILRKGPYRNPLNIGHLAAVITAMLFFMYHFHIFRYENMQYEIREFVITYAFLYWLISRIAPAISGRAGGDLLQ